MLKESLSQTMTSPAPTTISLDNNELLLVTPNDSVEGVQSNLSGVPNEVQETVAKVEEKLEKVMNEFQELAQHDKSVSFLNQETTDISQILQHSSGSSESNPPSNVEDEEFAIQDTDNMNEEELVEDSKPAAFQTNQTLESKEEISTSEGEMNLP